MARIMKINKNMLIRTCKRVVITVAFKEKQQVVENNFK